MEIVSSAEKLIGTPFDWKFDMEDKSALYCTELVLYAHRLSGGNLHIATKNEFIPIDSFQNSEISELILKIETK